MPIEEKIFYMLMFVASAMILFYVFEAIILIGGLK